MKTEQFLEKLAALLDTDADTPIFLTTGGAESAYQYMMADDRYPDGFVRIKVSNEHPMADMTVSGLMFAMAGVSPDTVITAVDIDDGTIYDIKDIFLQSGYTYISTR